MKTDFRHKHELRVRFAETDQQAIVFNGNYLVYYDVAWTEYFRDIGLDYSAFTRLGVDMVLARTTLEFKAAARFDDILAIYTRVASIGNTSLTLEFEIYNQKDETLINKASSLYVCIDPKTLSPTRVPDALREKIRTFEGTKE